MIHKAKKSLGQNFLKSESALKAIVEAGDISLKDTVLEIGPGKGALTERLLQYAGTVIAVEKDRDLLAFLREKFEAEIKRNKLKLIEGDILEFSPDVQRLGEYKIIANIPYNITGAILKKFLTETNQPERMVLMVQHEVAKRIIAVDKKESILSISVKAYGEPKMIMKVPARYFSPAPKVDSAIILIKNISRKTFLESKGRSSMDTDMSPKGDSGKSSAESESKFWEIVKTGFAHKRKKLTGNLKELFPDVERLEKWKDARAEDLTLADWIEITKYLG